MNLVCPDCDKSLTAETFNGVHVETCDHCAGVWLDAGELRTLIKSPTTLDAVEDENAPAIEQLPSGGVVRRCPKCDTNLQTYRYLYSSPVELDSCPVCYGIWVQDRELAKVEEALEASQKGAGMSPESVLAMANYEIQHDATIERQRRVTSLLRLLQRRPPFGRALGW